LAPSKFVNAFSESEAADLWRVTKVIQEEHAVDGPRAHVIDEDVELRELVPPASRDAAVLASRAAVLEVAAGTWDPSAESRRALGGYGLLVLDGVLVRRVDYGGRFGAEVLAGGDLLPPWELGEPGLEHVAGFETTWRMLSPTRLAVLDPHWTERMTRFTRIGPALAGRAAERSARLATMMAITQVPRLDDRLWRLLWELADRHGRVHPDGVHLDLPLTHEVLGQLAGARRPPVTNAISRLSQQGRVRRDGRGWILSGEPPAGV
jgi:CRP/FNR family transcriptional regulator, cyclic AMP receptor protein